MAANEIGTYCGERIPPAIASSGETLWINFMSDYSLAGNGFRLEYITNGMYQHNSGGIVALLIKRIITVFSLLKTFDLVVIDPRFIIEV